MEQIQLKRYIIEENVKELKFRMKQPSRKDQIAIFLLFCLLLIPFFLFSILFLIKSAFFYAVLFFIGSVGVMMAIIIGEQAKNKQLAQFQFIINADGVTHKDVDSTYFISWDEVVSYGFINNCSMRAKRKMEDYTQTCIYFAKTRLNEMILRKKAESMSIQKYLHCSSNEIIVFGLKEDDKDGLCYRYINQHIFCSKDKEKNYVK